MCFAFKNTRDTDEFVAGWSTLHVTHHLSMVVAHTLSDLFWVPNALLSRFQFCTKCFSGSFRSFVTHSYNPYQQ